MVEVQRKLTTKFSEVHTEMSRTSNGDLTDISRTSHGHLTDIYALGSVNLRTSERRAMLA